MDEQPKVIANKTLHKGILHGHISSGSKSVIEISHGKSIRFVALDDKFVHIQILEHGINIDIKSQSWVPGVKKVTPKKKEPVKQIKLTEDLEVEDVL